MPTLPQLLCRTAAALALTLPAAYAHAEDPFWTFVYQGFTVTHTDDSDVSETRYDPDLQLTGRFDAVDLNGDGAIEKSELTALTFSGLNYLACENPWNTTSCTINAFNYSPTSGLSFDLKRNSRDPEGYMAWTYEVVSGVRAISRTFSMFSGSQETIYDWTPDTTLVVAPGVTSPVPEPSSYLMFGAGALLLGALARRRRAG